MLSFAGYDISWNWNSFYNLKYNITEVMKKKQSPSINFLRPNLLRIQLYLHLDLGYFPRSITRMFLQNFLDIFELLDREGDVLHQVQINALDNLN